MADRFIADRLDPASSDAAGPGTGPAVPLLLVGLNHRTAPLELRERTSISDAGNAAALQSLLAIDRIDAAAILSTCNRVETIVSASDDAVVPNVMEWIARRIGATAGDLDAHLYALRGEEVVRHLFRVASGLDSMIVGEPQIGGQVKAAFLASGEAGALDGVLHHLFEQVMRVSKRVRTETGIGEHPVSVPFAAVELARKIFGDLRGLQVLLLGAGEMGELTAEHLGAQDVRQIFVANKTYPRALELARRFDGTAVRFDEFDRHLDTCDIIVASTSAPHFIIGSAQIAAAMANRKQRGLFLIDLAVPRNIDPEISQLENVYLYNIDDLQQVADANRELREKKVAEADAIIDEELVAFHRRLGEKDAVPTIVELQGRVEQIRAAELEKCLRKLGPITAAQRAAIEQLTSQIVKKILHHPIVHLKETAEPQERDSLRESIRKIFGLR